MLALGKLLELTLAGREPAQKIQLTVDGVQMRWLSEGALEVRPPQARDNGSDVLLSSGIHGNETAPILSHRNRTRKSIHGREATARIALSPSNDR